MSHISVVLLIALSFVPCCFSLGEFRCKAVPGCEIDTRCDPSPFSFSNLDRNEFPINCISNDAGKEATYDDKIKTLERKLEDMSSELRRVWDMNEYQNEDITRMKKQLEQSNKDITELQEKNEYLEEKVAILELKLEEKSLTLIPGTISTTPTSAEEIKPTTLALKKKSCQDVVFSEAKKTTESGGVFDVYPETVGKKIEVFCDLTTDEGGWTVFQRRMDGSEDFYRGWDDYVKGFGEKDKEFWLGLENLHQLTKTGKYELRVDLGDFKGNTAYAKYGSFRIDSSARNYKLHVSSYSGNAGDSLDWHNGMEFSTHNADHDTWSSGNCAERWKGSWWYNGCRHSNLNSLYHDAVGSGSCGVIWLHWKSHNEYLKFTEMKFRRK